MNAHTKWPAYTPEQCRAMEDALIAGLGHLDGKGKMPSNGLQDTYAKNGRSGAAKALASRQKETPTTKMIRRAMRLLQARGEIGTADLVSQYGVSPTFARKTMREMVERKLAVLSHVTDQGSKLYKATET